MKSSEQLTQTEMELAALWREVFGVDAVTGRSDFFDVGGDSLSAMQLIARVHDRYGVRLPLRAVFDAPTLAEFAQRLDQAKGSGFNERSG